MHCARADSEIISQVRDLFESMKAGSSPCDKVLLCKFWDESEERWSSDGCRTVKFDGEGGLVGCQCDHLTDFISIKVPTSVQQDEVQLLSIDPVQVSTQIDR